MVCCRRWHFPVALLRDDDHAGHLAGRRDDEPQAGRELLRRQMPTLASVTDPADRGKQAWVSAGLTFQGLKSLGVPQDALDSFPSAFQQGGVAVSGAAGSAGAATTPRPRVPQLMLMLDTESAG